MNKFTLLAVFVIILMAAGTGFAINQKNTGCGLGSMLLEDSDGLVSDTFAATTNGCCASQLFGITSGTSNCGDPESKAASNAKVEKFVAENMDNLAKDIAQGNGEYINTLASLMDIQETGTFNKKLQSNFSSIFTSDKVSSSEVVKNIQNVVNT